MSGFRDRIVQNPRSDCPLERRIIRFPVRISEIRNPVQTTSVRCPESGIRLYRCMIRNPDVDKGLIQNPEKDPSHCRPRGRVGILIYRILMMNHVQYAWHTNR